MRLFLIRVLGGGLALGLVLGLGGLALAQTPDPDSGAAERRLKDIETQMRKNRAEHEEIKRKATEITEELTRIRADMVAAAKAAQESETQLSDMESQLEELKNLEVEKNTTLSRRSAQMVGVLTAMQRLAWRPTEALIAQPQTPADTVRSAILLRAAVPQIQQSAADLKSELDMMAHLRSDIQAQRRKITGASARLANEHKRIRDLWDRKAGLQSAALAESEAAEDRMRHMAQEAEDLRDLLARLAQERQRRQAEAQQKALAEKAAREAELAALKAQKDAELAAQKAQHEAELAAKRAEKEQKEREIVAAKAAKAAELRAQTLAREAELTAQKAVRDAEKAAREAAAVKPLPSDRPFVSTPGSSPFPVRGKVVSQFGQANDLGVVNKGITIAARKGAQVISPFDGHVAFAGPFRGYGLLLIIEHGEGYHTLLAGMAQIDATVGQRLIAGEPVGIMGQDEAKPSLYVELRRNGQPINPLPWLTAQKSKASG